MDLGGKTKKRTKNFDVDDIFSQICSKMDSLSTSESSSNKDEIVAAFIDVLNCTSDNAVFFLESAAWNIESAIHIWLESNQSSQFYDSSSQNKVRYSNRQIIIPDLPTDWIAQVHPIRGNVIFINKVTGLRQNEVPPGYAELNSADGAMPTISQSHTGVRAGYFPLAAPGTSSSTQMNVEDSTQLESIGYEKYYNVSASDYRVFMEGQEGGAIHDGHGVYSSESSGSGDGGDRHGDSAVYFSTVTQQLPLQHLQKQFDADTFMSELITGGDRSGSVVGGDRYEGDGTESTHVECSSPVREGDNESYHSQDGVAEK